MPIRVRRSLPLAFAGLLLVILAAPTVAGPLAGSGPGVATSASASSATSPSGLVSRTNNKRTDRGLVVVREDDDLASIARDRAAVMAATDTMSHSEPNGTTVFDRIRSAGFTWYGAGEIIAWNGYSDQAGGVKAVIEAWMHSSGHRAIMLSTNYNYVGFGMAVSSSGKRYYAGVFAKEPDETGARARLGDVRTSRVGSDDFRVKVDWSGKDPRLQVLTAGLAKFEIQRRRVGGIWESWGVTKATKKIVNWSGDYDREIRIRARDKRGNWGAWKTVRIKI